MLVGVVDARVIAQPGRIAIARADIDLRHGISAMLNVAVISAGGQALFMF